MSQLPDTPPTPADSAAASAEPSDAPAAPPFDAPALSTEPPAVVAETETVPLQPAEAEGCDETAATASAEPVDPAAADPDTPDNPAVQTGIAAPPRAPDLSPAACGELLKQHFPALFTGPAKPMKLRIQQDIQQRAPGVFSKAALGAFFRRYTGSTGYLIALGKASQRFDLDGQPAGELSEEHRGLAREELTRRRNLGRERDQLAQAQQRTAQAQQQAAQAELFQARQARASLLRDFERTTLTPANFCALKGLSPETLTPQLELARREAAEAPPPRPFDDRRGPPGARRDDRPGPRPEGRRDRPNDGPREGPREARPPRNDGRAPAPRPPGRPGGRPGGGR